MVRAVPLYMCTIQCVYTELWSLIRLACLYRVIPWYAGSGDRPMAKKQRRQPTTPKPKTPEGEQWVRDPRGKFLVGNPPGVFKRGRPTKEIREYRTRVRQMIAATASKIDFEHLYLEDRELFVKELLPHLLGKPKSDIDLTVDTAGARTARLAAEGQLLDMLGKATKQKPKPKRKRKA